MKELEISFEANKWSPFGRNDDDGIKEGDGKKDDDMKDESVPKEESKQGKRRNTIPSKSKFLLVSTANSLIQQF